MNPKKNKNASPPEPPAEPPVENTGEENQGSEPNYNSPPEPPAEPPVEDSSKPIDSSKPYKLEDGTFGEHGTLKYYIKHKTRKQVERGNKMVFADDGTECGYHANLTKDDFNRRRKSGEIL